MDHAGSLGHTADDRFVTVKLDLIGGLLVNGVSCHDRLGCFRACLDPGAPGRCQHSDAFSYAVDGKLESDDSCGAYKNGILFDSETGRCFLRGLTAVFHSLLTGAGVCDAGVYDHSMRRRAAVHQISVPDHRRGFYDVGRKRAGCHAGGPAEYQSHIGSAFIFNMRRRGSGFESLCCCNAADDLLHDQSSISLSINLVIFASLRTNS